MENLVRQLRQIAIVTFLYISAGASVNAAETDPRAPDRQMQLLQKTIDGYEKSLRRGAWEELKLPSRGALKLNDTADVLVKIKDRLELLGDLRNGRSTNVFTDRLEASVRQFQYRHGLLDDGIIGPEFIKALNIPLDKRIEQMKINMQRIKIESSDFQGKKIIANIPEYKLYVFEDKDVVLSMDIVVGKATNQTVVFTDTMESVVFSPYWNIPESIVKAEILPAMNRNASYLSRNNMEVTGKVNGYPQIRQKPGPDNSLGLVKFMFPNKYNIYFHDTPSKSLFEKHKRAFSHGCIRLSEPLELAKYLLKDRPEWDEYAIMKAMSSGSEKWVKINEKIPVSIIYNTAWVDQEGLVHFRDDIYGLDKEAEVFTQSE